MQIAARTAAWAKSGGWVNPYVTDGLIAMWDGEWNAGGGVHDPNATVWKDCIAGLDANISESGSLALLVRVDDDRIHIENAVCECISHSISEALNSGNYSFEYVVSRVNIRQYLLSETWSNGSMYIRWIVNGVTSETTYGSGIPSDGSLYHFAFTSDNFNRKSYSRNMQTVDSFSQIVPTLIYDDNIRLFGYPVRDIGFFGDISAVRIYNRALTAAEIAANCAIDKARFGLTEN